MPREIKNEDSTYDFTLITEEDHFTVVGKIIIFLTSGEHKSFRFYSRLEYDKLYQELISKIDLDKYIEVGDTITKLNY